MRPLLLYLTQKRIERTGHLVEIEFVVHFSPSSSRTLIIGIPTIQLFNYSTAQLLLLLIILIIYVHQANTQTNVHVDWYELDI